MSNTIKEALSRYTDAQNNPYSVCNRISDISIPKYLKELEELKIFFSSLKDVGYARYTYFYNTKDLKVSIDFMDYKTHIFIINFEDDFTVYDILDPETQKFTGIKVSLKHSNATREELKDVAARIKYLFNNISDVKQYIVDEIEKDVSCELDFEKSCLEDDKSNSEALTILVGKLMEVK